MPVTRLNHAVLFVRNVEQSVAFYRDALGFEKVMGMPGRRVPPGAGLVERPRPRACSRSAPARARRPPAAARSASTTWRGRWTRSTSSAGSRRSSPSSAR